MWARCGGKGLGSLEREGVIVDWSTILGKDRRGRV